MEQKGLDEIQESFLGEEIIEDEVSFMTENKIKKSAVSKKKAELSKGVSEKPKILTAEEIEDVIITPTEAKQSEVKVENMKITPTVEEVKIKSLENEHNLSTKKDLGSSSASSKVEPWGNDPAEPTGSNAWAILSGVLVVLLLISVFTSGFDFGSNNASGDQISLSQAEDIVQDFVNSNLLPAPFTAGFISSEDIGELYRVTLSVNGQEIDSYITKNGKLFFPQGLDLNNYDLTGELGEDLTENDDVNEYVEVDRIEVSVDDDAIKGEWDAPVTIVEFSDYECPFCGKFYSETLPLIVENYIDTEKARLVFRDFPLEFHPNAMGAAIAAECAGEQGNYFFFHDKLFENQDSLSREFYIQLAEDYFLDVDDFTSCLDSEEIVAEIEADLAEGQSYGVTGTPGFFVNGEKIDGAQPYEVFAAAIERALVEIEYNKANEAKMEDSTDESTDEDKVEAENSDEEMEAVVEDESDESDEISDNETAIASVTFDIVAKKWRFDPSTISVKVGDPVSLNIMPEGIDEFTFSIEGLGVEEVINGETLISFTANSVGTFEYSCSSCEEFRGMSGELIVE